MSESPNTQHETPNTKLQTPDKFQAPNINLAANVPQGLQRGAQGIRQAELNQVQEFRPWDLVFSRWSFS